MTDITVADLTQTTLDGTGVFDTLMRANKVHLESEFALGRIKGTEYATVYLGSLETVLRTSMEFLLQRQKISLEAQLMEQQILLAQVEVIKANAAVALVEAQTANAVAELAILQANVLKVPAEIAQLTAQTALTGQQKLNLIAEGLNIPKQGILLDAQKLKVDADVLQTEKQSLLTTQQTLNLVADNLNIPKQGLVLDGQKCKLDAEFDLLQSEKLKSVSETALLSQKGATEKAQTTAMGVDDNSVIGKQKILYQAQAEGFQRDAEQKATKILIDTWNVRKTTDPDDTGLGLPVTNASIEAAVLKLKTGIGA